MNARRSPGKDAVLSFGSIMPNTVTEVWPLALHTSVIYVYLGATNLCHAFDNAEYCICWFGRRVNSDIVLTLLVCCLMWRAQLFLCVAVCCEMLCAHLFLGML